MGVIDVAHVASLLVVLLAGRNLVVGGFAVSAMIALVAVAAFTADRTPTRTTGPVPYRRILTISAHRAFTPQSVAEMAWNPTTEGQREPLTWELDIIFTMGHLPIGNRDKGRAARDWRDGGVMGDV